MSDTSGNPPAPSEGTPPPAPPADPPKAFSQADVDKFAGDARESGRRAAEKALLESLGVTDLEAAKSALAAHAAAEEASKSELQRAQEEAARYKAESEAVKAEAARTLAISRVEGALRDAGVNPARIPAALRLVDASNLAVNGTEVTGVAEAVESIKRESPEWFGTPAAAPDASAGATGGNGKPDYRSMSPQDRRRVLQKDYGVRMP